MSENDGVLVESRKIPFPSSISPKARQYLESLIGPDGVPFGANKETLPAVDNLDGWARLNEEVNANIARMYADRSTRLTSTVETKELGGATVHVATPVGLDPSDNRALLYIHGGGMVYGAGEPCIMWTRIEAELHGVRFFGVDYRTPPENCYPHGLDDCVSAYRALLETHAPQNIIVHGISGGGNLAAAAVLRIRDEGLSLPAGLVLLTPEVDLTESGDSFQTNHRLDSVLVDTLMNLNLVYANGEALTHPYVSPLFGDFNKGYPPTFLQAGGRDLFLSNAVRMHRALRTAGVEAELHIFEGMTHGGFHGAPEDDDLDAEVARFVASHWGVRSAG